MNDDRVFEICEYLLREGTPYHRCIFCVADERGIRNTDIVGIRSGHLMLELSPHGLTLYAWVNTAMPVYESVYYAPWHGSDPQRIELLYRFTETIKSEKGLSNEHA